MLRLFSSIALDHKKRRNKSVFFRPGRHDYSEHELLTLKGCLASSILPSLLFGSNMLCRLFSSITLDHKKRRNKSVFFRPWRHDYSEHKLLTLKGCLAKARHCLRFSSARTCFVACSHLSPLTIKKDGTSPSFFMVGAT